ncbi:MAG: hypothetical protein GHCLOJNM_01075 [bacterium]|nr:hypothetical protein [bacterium]
MAGGALGGFFFRWIATESNYPHLLENGKAWVHTVSALLPHGELFAQRWSGTALSRFTAYFPGLLIGSLMVPLAWALLALRASWQNCLLFSRALLQSGWALFPLLLYGPLCLLQDPRGKPIAFGLALVPFAASAFLLHRVLTRIRLRCLPDSSQRIAPKAETGFLSKGLVWFGSSLLFLLWSWLALTRHWHYHSQGYDLGLMAHVLNRFVTGHGLTSSLIVSGGSFLGHHFSPTLVLFSPLYFFCPHPEVLLVTQAGAVAFASIPLYHLAARCLGPSSGAAISLLYLFLPGLSDGVLSDFHAISLAPCLFFWLVLECGTPCRWRFGIPLILLLAVQENLFLYSAALGLFLVLAGSWFGVTRKRGVFVLLASLAWGVLVFGVIQPLVQPHAEAGYGFVKRYRDFIPEGMDPKDLGVAGLAGQALSHPLRALALIFSEERLEVYERFWRGIGYLPLWNPLSWILLLPCLENSLSSEAFLYVWSGHYAFGPMMVTALGVVSSLRLLARWKFPARILPPIAWTFAWAALLWTVTVAPFPLSRANPAHALKTACAFPEAGSILRTKLPLGCSVSAQSVLLPHLTHEDSLYLLPPGVPLTNPGEISPDANEFERLVPSSGWPDFLVFDRKSNCFGSWYNLWFYSKEETLEWLDWLVASGRYRLYHAHLSLTILERAPEQP